jgi:hypothetical protein
MRERWVVVGRQVGSQGRVGRENGGRVKEEGERRGSGENE